MGTFPWALPPLHGQYGPLPEGFTLTVAPGYSALVGPNNVGKSAILQAIFGAAFKYGEIGRERLCYLSPDRVVIANTTEVGGRSLGDYNSELAQYVTSGPLNYEYLSGPNRNELFRVLLNHTDFMRQSQGVPDYLKVLGLPRMTLRQAQTLHFDMVLSGVQGSGIRSILPILAALTDSDLKLILIDEPESSLEPALQRSLRRLLVQEASAQRPIIVATHSHLFLDPSHPGSVVAVSRESGELVAKPLSTSGDLIDVTFRLLGNSLEDLYFPGNFLVVEGASDQRILEKVIELMGEPNSRIKVLSAQGVDRVRSTVHAIEQALVPLLAGDSPYAGRVVALIDKPQKGTRIAGLRAALRDRLFELDKPSMEEYLPVSVYTRAGLDKAAVIEEIRLSQDQFAKSDIKRRVSDAIAGALQIDDVDKLEVLKLAVLKSLDGLE